MGVEHERKFLVTAEPGPDAERSPPLPLRQAYVAIDDDRSVRVRQAGGAATLTIKAGRGLSRTEVEIGLGDADFEQLWAVGQSRAIEKHRTRVALGDGLVAELDEFTGRHTGLRLVEVEFTSPEAAAAFAPPPWFGDEVTAESWASNAWLSTHDLTDLPEHRRPDHAE